MRAITSSLLDKHCKQPAEALPEGDLNDSLDALGWLSPFLLSDSALERARQARPEYEKFYSRWLPGGLGACQVVFVGLRNKARKLLGQAVVLPLRWVRGADHDPHLPGDVRRVADDVLRVLQMTTSGWVLSLNAPEYQETRDLSSLPVTADSGWPALAGGLLLAKTGLLPDRHIWATGRWEDQLGLVPVDGLKEKMELARRYGATAFFMPIGDEARSLEAVNQLFVQLFPAPERNARNALAPYLTRLGVPPGREEPFETRRAYYQLLSTPEARTQFYCEALLETIVARLDGELSMGHGKWRPSHFVTVLSGGLELALLVPRALGAAKCLMLYSNDPFGNKAWKQVEGLKAFLGSVTPIPFAFDNDKPLEPQFRVALAEFLKNVASPDQIAFDLTPGQRPMSWALESLAPEGSSLVYARHKSDGNNRAVPDVERLLRRRAAEPVASRLVLPIG